MFLCGAADAFAHGTEENALPLRGALAAHSPQRGGKATLCCRAMRWPHGLQRGGKATLCCRAVRWPHAHGTEGKSRFAAAQCAGRMACGAEGKPRFFCAARWPPSLRRGGKVTLCRCAMRWPHALQRGGKVTLCRCAVRWPPSLRRGEKATLFSVRRAVGERGKTGNIPFQNVLFQKNNTKSSQFYGCVPVSQAADCVLMAWNTAMSNFGSRL